MVPPVQTLPRSRFGLVFLVFGALAWLAVAALGARADINPEELGQIVQLPEDVGEHWVWVPDRLARHSVLFDGDTGNMIGAVDSGAMITPKPPMWSRTRNELITVHTAYSRGHWGDRVDAVTIYDARSLSITGEIMLPPKTADTSIGVALVGLLDGERFMVAQNQIPGSTVSIVDLEKRSFVGEIPTAGCSGVYPVGERRFGTLCGDGTALAVTIDDKGKLSGTAHTAKFFDPVKDPITMSGVRAGSRWLFASFEGFLYEVDFSSDTPSTQAPWSLFTDAERGDGWRIGGAQHLAYHNASKRLYSLVHEGGAGSHKDAGPEIWVYDSTSRTRVRRFKAPNVLPGFLRPVLKLEPGSWSARVLGALLPNPGVQSIAVTQDNHPLLFARHGDIGSVVVIDADTGKHLRDLEEAGVSGALLVVP